MTTAVTEFHREGTISKPEANPPAFCLAKISAVSQEMAWIGHSLWIAQHPQHH
jgi:hypothetical protein